MDTKELRERQEGVDPRISGLEKQLRIENMVKQGAENMIKSYTAGKVGLDTMQLMLLVAPDLPDSKLFSQFVSCIS